MPARPGGGDPCPLSSGRKRRRIIGFRGISGPETVGVQPLAVAVDGAQQLRQDLVGGRAAGGAGERVQRGGDRLVPARALVGQVAAVRLPFQPFQGAAQPAPLAGRSVPSSCRSQVSRIWKIAVRPAVTSVRSR